MEQNQSQNQFKQQHSAQQQSLGNVQVQGDDNILNMVQAETVTLTQNKIIQISVDEIKTRPFITTSPYKGLRSFEPEDKDQFFGRDQFLAGLVSELEQTNLLLLLGASGSGKSSVVRAGLVPWLCQKWGTRMVNLMVTPDQDPFESLYGSLLRHFKQSEAQVARVGQVNTLSQVVKTLKQPESFWFIFIDQFEELFTISDPEKRDRFIASLARLCQERVGDRTLKIVATMRADFLDRLDADPANRLARLTEKHRPLMTQMHPDELRLAIEQPAAHHGVVFEKGLVETIIRDVQGQAGYLPLLQYTLAMLWESEVKDGGIHDRTLNIQSYRRIGGVRGALQQQVSEIYQALSKPEKLAAQRIFLKLVGIGGDTTTETDWKPVRKREVRSRFTNEQEQTVLTQLINANLLVSDAPAADAEATVEIAHEILLTSWSELKNWIEQNREAIALRNRLTEDVAQWQSEKLDDELWSGTRLAKAVDLQSDPTFHQVLGGFSPDVTQFIEASVRLRDRQAKAKETQRRRFVLGLSGFSMAALVLSGVALYQLHRVQRQRIELLATNAKALLTSQPIEARVNALAAINLSESPFVKFPDWSRFVSAEGSVLDTIKDTLERNRLLHEESVYVVVVSPDGSMIVSGGENGSIQRWDARTGEPIGEPLSDQGDRIRALAFSPDGSILISGSEDNSIRLWNAQTREPIGEPLIGHKNDVTSIAFSPDGRTIVSGSEDNSIRLWNAQTKEPIGDPLVGHEDDVIAVAFNPKGNMIASGSNDNNIRLWNAQTRKPIGDSLTGHKGNVRSVAFSPDGGTIVSGSGDNSIRIWDVKTRKPIDQPLMGHEDAVDSVAFSPDGSMIASGGWDHRIRLWNAQKREPIGEPLIGHESWVTSVAFSPDGSKIVSGSLDDSVRLWNAQPEEAMENPAISHDNGFTAVAFSPDSGTIVSGSQDNSVRLWDAQTREPIGEPLIGHQDEVTSVAVSPDGSRIVSASRDNSIRLWDAQTREPIGEPLTGHESWVTSVAFSPDGSKIVSGSLDDSVRLWNVQTGKLIGEPLIGHQDGINAVTFSPDGSMVASGSRDNRIRLWNAQTGELIGEPLIGHNNNISSIAFSPDGNIIASGDWNGNVRLWNVRTRKPTRDALPGDQNSVRTVAFSQDGKTIASGGWEKSVRLWNVQTGEPIGSPLTGHSSTVLSIAFSPDGNALVSGSEDNSLRLWDASPQSWIRTACTQLQNHSILINPTNDVARAAKQTCDKYG